MTIRAVTRRRTIVAALVAMSSLAIGGTAGADGAGTQSLSNICVYQHQLFGGESQCFDNGGNVKPALNDQISSIDNEGWFTQTWCLYEHADYQGHYLVVGDGEYHKNLRYDPKPGGGNWNDTISSLKPC